MIDMSKILPAEPSRRAILQTFAMTAGGAAMLGTAMRGAAAEGKMAPATAGYQDKPEGARQCDNCAQFVAPGSCKVVEGAISPSGWCRIYVKKA